MRWYVAKMVYQVDQGNQRTPQIDEQYTLIRADEFSWAREKAQTLGRLGECLLDTEHNSKVSWKFINVVDLIEIGELCDGAQLFSATAEPEDLEEYIALSEMRARRLMDSCA